MKQKTTRGWGFLQISEEYGNRYLVMVTDPRVSKGKDIKWGDMGMIFPEGTPEAFDIWGYETAGSGEGLTQSWAVKPVWIEVTVTVYKEKPKGAKPTLFPGGS